MADTPGPTMASSLSPPASEVPAQQQSEAQSQQQTQPPPQPQSAEEPKAAKGASKEKQPPQTDGAGGDTPEKLTAAELKKRAKADKIARRAKERAERESGGGGPGQGGASPAKKAQPGKDAAPGPSQKGQRPLPYRPAQTAQTAGPEPKKKEDKSVAVFGHLYGQQRRTSVAGAGKEIHPAVLALGLQMRDYVVCGSSARCVATLLAFKRVCSSCLCLEWYGC